MRYCFQNVCFFLTLLAQSHAGGFLSYGCKQADGAGCKTCVDSKYRSSDSDCASCNDGFFLFGTSCVSEPPKGSLFLGEYVCPQGPTGLQVHVDEWPEARFEFYPVESSTHKCSGEFRMSGSVNGSTMTFEPKLSKAWRSNPCGYTTIGLVGEVSSSGRNFSGSIPGCSLFNTSLERNTTQAALTARRLSAKAVSGDRSQKEL